MKKGLFFIAAALLWAACQPAKTNQNPSPNDVSTVKIGEPFTVAAAKSATIESEGLKITFEKVLAESRCPKGVQCIAAGRVDLEFSFEKAGKIQRDSFGIGSPSGPPFRPESRVVFGKTVKILEVTPQPEAKKPIPMADYKVKLVVN